MRLKGYNYSKKGIYFVTNVVMDRLCLFGRIKDEEMILNDAGKMIEKWFLKLEEKFPGIKCHEYVIMPNHYHILIEIFSLPKNNISNIAGADPSVRPRENNCPNLSRVLQWFKSMTTNDYIKGVKEKGWRRFKKKLWQRSFDDRIMKGYELESYKDYIKNNSKNWKERWK
ncbi:MAG: transposase [Candidatus Marinimicrobia bacterium]|nr:transposase [Candidatus Neomarinimicrobiota bacterium]